MFKRVFKNKIIKYLSVGIIFFCAGFFRLVLNPALSLAGRVPASGSGQSFLQAG